MLYNDAYIPLLGADLHPQALGRPVREIWPDLWNLTGPFVEQVMVYGRSIRRDDMQMVLERNGYPEECYFTFSYSPILGADGTAGGVFTIVTETTGKLLAERRLRLVRTLGAVSATQAGTMADTCRAMLDVMAGTRQSVPFAVALLREDADGRPHGVGAYGLAADAWSLGMSTDGFDDEAAIAANA